MAEPLPVPQQTFEVVPETNPDPNLTPPLPSAGEEIAAKWRTTGTMQFLRRQVLLPIGHPADPTFNPWAHMKGHEGDEADLASARSQSEFDAMVGFLERNKRDHYTAENGPLGLIGDIIAGIADPINVVPIPIVKGIGWTRGALLGGASVGALSAGEEYLRQTSDPLARPEEAFWNIGLGTVLGGLVGAPVGAWGAGAARRARAIRAMDEALSDPDNPNFSLKPRDDDGYSYKYERPPRNPDGSYSRFKTVDEIAGYEPKLVDGVRYVYDGDNMRWVSGAEGARAEPLSVSDEIAEQLGQPTPIMGKTLYIDELANKAEFGQGRWHDELQSYVEQDVPIERIVLDENDFSNFRTYEHRWESRLPRLASETADAWRARVGKAAMKEFRASKVPAGYAGPQGIAWILERLNFSPVAKLIRTFDGDNYVADLALRVGGDYGWAIKANSFGWSTPPSILLKQIRHTARYHQWLAVFDGEFLKYASGNQQAQGRLFQSLNIGAAGYNKINGVRRMGGAKVITKDIFEEMVAEAVFRKGDFEVQGFPVNDNVRAASKAFTEMAQEYDELHRAAGNFRDQKKLNSDIKYWRKQEIHYKNAVMQWLWGATGKPANLQHAIKVKGRTEKFTSYDQFELLDSMDDQADLIDQYSAVRWKGKTHFGETHQEVIERVKGLDPTFEAALDANPGPILGWVKKGTGDRIFTGTSHDEAIQKMIDALGDDGIALSEQLTAQNYGYTYREAAPAAARPAPVAEVGAAPAPPADFEAIAARLLAEDTAEQARLRALVDAGTATPDDIAGLKAIDRRILRRQAGEMGIGPKRMEATGEFDSFAFDPYLAKFTNLGQALSYILENPEDYGVGLSQLISRILPDVKDIPLHVIDEDTLSAAVAMGADDLLGRGALGVFDPVSNTTRVRGWMGHVAGTEELLEAPSGTNPIVIAHEAVHASTNRRIERGIADRKMGQVTPYTAMLDELEGLRDEFFTLADRDRERLVAGMDMAGRMEVDNRLNLAKADIHEFLTYATTQPQLRTFLQNTPARRPRGAIQTLWDEIVDLYLRLTGKEVPTRADQLQLEQLLDIVSRYTAMEQPLLQGELAPGVKAMMGPEPTLLDEPFVSVDDAMDQRIRRLSPKQRAIYDQRAGSLAMAQENLARAEADLKLVTDMPHQFVDANGNAEPWYHRIWDKAKGATEREQLTRLIEKWYERDNPDGARQRAVLTVDNILNEDAEIGDKAGMSALSQRKLNIPNSWSISDPQFGEIRVSDFIDKRIRSVADHYIHRSAAKIETARMFGDSEMRAEKVRLREYLMQRYYEPATSDAERAAAMARIEEAEGWLDIINKSVAGTLRTTDPWRLDNRIARAVMNITTLGIMGRVAVSNFGEVVRPGMVNGFGTYFRTLFTKYLDDLEAMRGNIEFGGLTAELNDLSMNRMHVQQATIQNGEPSLGGTSFERWLNDKAGGLYHIAGLTSLTTWQKVMSGLAAQHSVMADARLVGQAMLEGRPVDGKAAFRLRAMGIGDRDAMVLAGMPVEFYQGGKLILPAVDNWKALGADGRRAREVLLNGIHAEMRRSIVTPSIGDRSTIFNGVWTRKGKKVFESDLMTIPMQFLSYGMGAHNKLLTSSIQGRDRDTTMGLFFMMLSGILATWLLSDEGQWRKKSYDQILADGFDKSGIGGFWFNGINGQIERVTNNRMSYRKLLGIDPDFKHDPSRDNSAMLSAAGAAPKYFYDISRAFWDTSITGSQRAQLIRRGIPYNNVYWWEKAFDTMANEAGEALGGSKR